MRRSFLAVAALATVSCNPSEPEISEADAIGNRVVAQRANTALPVGSSESASASTSQGPCGESFCLPIGSKLIKRSPVEDFNLYEVEWRDTQFSIYEGNHPDEGDAPRTALSLPIDAAASIGLAEGRGSIIVKLGKPWPAYLDLMGPCRASEKCPLKSFAAELTPR